MTNSNWDTPTMTSVRTISYQKGCHLWDLPIKCQLYRECRLFFYKLFREVQILLFLIGCWCMLITVVSSDNNRKASDVKSFHPAVTQQAKRELWKWTSLSVSTPCVCLTHSAARQPKPTPNTRRDYLFISNYSVFSKVAAANKRHPVMLPLSLTAPVWKYHYYCLCRYSCRPLTGRIHTTACEYGSAPPCVQLRSRLNHCPSELLRSDKVECWHFTKMEDISLCPSI